MNGGENQDLVMLQGMRDARDAPAVLKAKLATIRADSAGCVVFACEGIQDKIVYFHWLRDVAPFFVYEFLVCKGKGKLLEFRELLRRDVTSLGRYVYYGIDRDFDDLRGFPAGDDIFMTSTYSVENYLVDRTVLDAILRVELHCHGEPAKRNLVIQKFDELYDSFLQLTQPHNRRIHASRVHQITNTKPWPEKINHLAKVAVDSVEASDHQVNHVIALGRDPSEAEIYSCDEAFSNLDPKSRYRGKFALLFFQRWLQLLADDRVAPAPIIFAEVEKTTSVSRNLALDAIAAKSRAPQEFREFVARILATLPHPPLAA